MSTQKSRRDGEGDGDGDGDDDNNGSGNDDDNDGGGGIVVVIGNTTRTIAKRRRGWGRPQWHRLWPWRWIESEQRRTEVN